MKKQTLVIIILTVLAAAAIAMLVRETTQPLQAATATYDDSQSRYRFGELENGSGFFMCDTATGTVWLGDVKGGSIRSGITWRSVTKLKK